MTLHKRPGGLTALAVLNFVFGGFGALGLLITVAALSQPEFAAALAVFGSGFFYVVLAVSVVQTFLIIAAGVGYLKLKPWGRTLGNAYGAIAVIMSLVSAVVVPSDLGGGMNIMTIIGLIYPVLTLVLLNTTFREDFRQA